MDGGRLEEDAGVEDFVVACGGVGSEIVVASLACVGGLLDVVCVGGLLGIARGGGGERRAFFALTGEKKLSRVRFLDILARLGDSSISRLNFVTIANATTNFALIGHDDITGLNSALQDSRLPGMD